MARTIAVAFSLLVVSTIVADDWPQWRGPNRDGVSVEKGLLAKWPEGGPTLAWKYKNAGLGFSSFAVRDGKVYTLGSRENNEVVLALDAVKGTDLWTAKIGPLFTYKTNWWGDGPRGTPTLDGNLLFALGGQGDLVCVDLAKKGAEVWRKNLITDFDGVMMTEWGYSESPLVDGDRLIVTPGGKKGLVVALDKKTGALLWQSSEVPHRATYCSMIAAEIHGARQYIQLSYIKGTGGFVNGVAAKDGKLLWQAPISKSDSYAICPTPIVVDNFVYVTIGDGHGCHRFEIGKNFQPTETYGKKEQKSTKNYFGGVVLIAGKIYGHSEGLGWVCQDLKSGKIVWNERDAFETRSGATMAVGDMLYLLSQEGQVGLVKASREKFDLVSEFKLPQLSAFPQMRPSSKDSAVWSHPVVANGRLYLRDCELIYCYDIAAK